MEEAERCFEQAPNKAYTSVVKGAKRCSELALIEVHMAVVEEARRFSELAATEKNLDHPHYLVIQQLQSRAGSE